MCADSRVVRMKKLFLSIAIPFILYCSVSGSQKIDKPGFRYLGSIEPTARQLRWSYFVSTFMLNVADAMDKCRLMFGGRLLTIFTKEEDEFIRIQLQIEGLIDEFVATSGKYNTLSTKWEWSSTGTEFIYNNFKPPIIPPGPERCVHVVGQLSSYTWVHNPCDGETKFICQF